MAVTKQQFNTLEDLFVYYNKNLFDGMLPDTLITLANHKGAAGLFAPSRWVREGTEIHEITISPESIIVSEIDYHQTLVHEMCHLWQHCFGKPSRQCYHNKEWANKMEEVGLMPSSTGEPGGSKTGQHMRDYPIDGGLFESCFRKIDALSYAKTLKLPLNPNVWAYGGHHSVTKNSKAGDKQESRSGVKVKYSCSCGTNVWGKSGLSITCNHCNEIFE